jgi:hypothetical protein
LRNQSEKELGKTVPYTIRKSKKKGDKRPWKIINTATKQVVGTSMTRKKAVGSMVHREDAMKSKGEMKKMVKKASKRMK